MLQFQDEIQEMQSNRPACAKGVVTKEKKKKHRRPKLYENPPASLCQPHVIGQRRTQNWVDLLYLHPGKPCSTEGEVKVGQLGS